MLTARRVGKAYFDASGRDKKGLKCIRDNYEGTGLSEKGRGYTAMREKKGEDNTWETQTKNKTTLSACVYRLVDAARENAGGIFQLEGGRPLHLQRPRPSPSKETTFPGPSSTVEI